jgi:hypothetical protein
MVLQLQASCTSIPSPGGEHLRPEGDPPEGGDGVKYGSLKPDEKAGWVA